MQVKRAVSSFRQHLTPRHGRVLLIRLAMVRASVVLADIVIYSNACDVTTAANQLVAEAYPVDSEDLVMRLACAGLVSPSPPGGLLQVP